VPQVAVGLGNPGPAYQDTRHNVGQAVVDRLAQRLHRRFHLRGPAWLAETEWAGAPLYLAKPIAFMNVVGPRVARLLADLGLDASSLIVVHDDLDLPFGRVRVRHQGRHGGHNGVRSLIETLDTEAFRRVKIGIGRPETRDEVVDWVLTPFTPEEHDALPAVLERAAEAVLELAGAGPLRGQGAATVI
jgi:PTH1 family peptidyl-tRNA hydrolase